VSSYASRHRRTDSPSTEEPLNMGWPSDLTLYKLFQDQGSFIGGIFALIAGLAAYIGAVRAARMQVKAVQEQMASAQQSADEQIAAAARQIGEMRTQAATQERWQATQRREQRYALALAIRSEEMRIADAIRPYEDALKSLSPGTTWAPPSDYREIPINDVLRTEWRALALLGFPVATATHELVNAVDRYNAIVRSPHPGVGKLLTSGDLGSSIAAIQKATMDLQQPLILVLAEHADLM
jgi:hypothetical protein